MDAIEFPGLWWLPESPHRQVPGVLSIDRSGLNRLTLIGEMRDPLAFAARTDNVDGSTRFDVTEDSLDRAGSYPRVLGQSGSSEFTLEDGFRRRHQSQLFGGMATEEIQFNQSFQGVWLEHNEPLAFDRVRISLQWLAPWLQRSGLSESIVVKNNRPTALLRRVDLLPRRRIRLGDGLTLYIQHRIGTSGDRISEAAVTQHHTFEIQSTTKRPLRELMHIAALLQALVSIGTGRIAGFEDVKVMHPDVREGPGELHRYRRPIVYRAQWSARDDQHDRVPHDHEMPFTLPSLGGPQRLSTWITIADRFHHQIDMVMSTRHGRPLVSDKLIYRVAALEGFHKLLVPGRRDLAVRLRACAELAGEPFSNLVGDVEAWVVAAKEQRNHIGHGSHPGDIEGSEVLFLADAAYWLFVLCLLRQIGAPESVYERIAAIPEYRWLGRRLTEVLTPPMA